MISCYEKNWMVRFCAERGVVRGAYDGADGFAEGQ